MKTALERKPPALYLLTAVLLFLGAGALYGGYSLVADPSGKGLGMPVEWLRDTGFPDYRIPGLILLTVLGVLPLAAALLLWLRPEWGLMKGLERSLRLRWVWGVAFGVGVAQVIWIVYQVTTMGLTFFLQPLFLGVGLLICGLCLWPSVRHYCRA